MASSGAIKAGEAFIRLFGDDSALQATLKGAEKRLKALGTAVAAVGAGLAAVGGGTLTGLFSASKAFSAAGDAVDKMNKRTGLSTEFISEVGFAAEQSGSNIEELEKGFRKYQQTLGDAVQGNKEAADAFAEVGLSVQDLLGMSPDEQFYAISKAIAAVGNEAKRTEAAMALLGRGGAQLIPLFMEGADGIDALRRQAHELGLTFTAEDAKSAAVLNDSLNALSRSVKALWVWIGSALAPAFTQAANAITAVVSATSEWVRENRGVVIAVAAVAAGVTALGGALIAVGVGITLLGVAIGAIGTTIGVFSAVVGGVISTIGALGTFIISIPGLIAGLVAAVGSAFGAVVAAGGAMLAFLTSTVGLITLVSAAGVILAATFVDWGRVVDWLRQQLGKFGEVLTWLGRRFDELKSVAIETYLAIADAFKAGDLELAARIAWAGVEVASLQGLAALNAVWEDMKYGALSAWNLMWAALASGAAAGMRIISQIIVDGISRLSDPLLNIYSVINPGAATGLKMSRDAIVQAAIPSSTDADYLDRLYGTTKDLAAKQAELATASAEDKAAAEAAVIAAQERLKALEAAAATMRKIKEEESRQANVVGRNISSLTSSREASFGAFGGRSTESFAFDRLSSPIERTAVATERTAAETSRVARGIESLGSSLVFG